MKGLVYYKSLVFLSILGLVGGQAYGQGSSDIGTKVMGGMLATASAVMLTGAVVDTVKCSSEGDSGGDGDSGDSSGDSSDSGDSSGDSSGGTRNQPETPTPTVKGNGVFGMAGACSEAVLAGIGGLILGGMAASALATGDEQKADPYKGGMSPYGENGGGGDGDDKPRECTQQEKDTCRRLERIGNVKKQGCICIPSTTSIDDGVPIPALQNASPEVQEAAQEALATQSLEPLEKVGGDFGRYASVANLDEAGKKVDAAADELESQGVDLGGVMGGAQITAPEPEEEVEDASIADDKGMYLTGKGGKIRGSRVASLYGGRGGKDRLSKLSGEEKRKARKQWKKLSKKKKSGVIGNPRQGLFAVVGIRYDKMEKKDFHHKHYRVKRGKLVEIKFIPDKDVVKGAVKKAGKTKGRKGLGKQIEKFVK